MKWLKPSPKKPPTYTYRVVIVLNYDVDTITDGGTWRVPATKEAFFPEQKKAEQELENLHDLLRGDDCWIKWGRYLFRKNDVKSAFICRDRGV